MIPPRQYSILLLLTFVYVGILAGQSDNEIIDNLEPGEDPHVAREQTASEAIHRINRDKIKLAYVKAICDWMKAQV